MEAASRDSSWPTVLATAVGMFLLLDAVRVWLPSLSIVFGATASAQPRELAAACLLSVAAVTTLQVRRLTGPTLGLTLTAVIVVAARLLVQASSGGAPQLWSSTIAVVALMGWFVALARIGASTRRTAVGAALGLAAQTTLHTVLGTVDLTWQEGALPWLAVTLSAAGLLVGSHLIRPDSDASAAVFFFIGPAAALAGLLTAAPSRAWVSTGWSDEPLWAAPLVVLGACLGVVAAWRGGLSRASWPSSTLLVVATVFATWPGDVGVLPPQAAAAAALGAVAGAAGRSAGRRTPALRGWVCVAGFAVFGLLTGGYYAGHYVLLPFGTSWLLPAAAVILGLAALTARSAELATSRRTTGVGVATAAATALATFVVGVVTAPSLDKPRATDLPLRVMTYNIHYGIAADGRFDAAGIAATIRRAEPDVVVLQEVDRGWFLNGGHDTLRRLAGDVHMRYVFSPSTDELMGEAILTRVPFADVQVTPLPRAGVPMRAATLSAVLDIPGGPDLAVVTTHLHLGSAGVAKRQVVAVADVVEGHRESGRDVVLAGDFNLEPTDGRLAPLLTVLEDGLRRWRPTPTYPADDPTSQRDHVFVSPGLSTSGLDVDDSLASDHLPIALTIRR